MAYLVIFLFLMILGTSFVMPHIMSLKSDENIWEYSSLLRVTTETSSTISNCLSSSNSHILSITDEV